MRRFGLLVFVLGVPVSSCRDSAAQEPPPRVVAIPRAGQASAVPVGGDLAQRFVTHAEYLRPGMVPAPAGMLLRNPHEGDPAAIATGEKLFVAYNCVDCHGAGGSGAMGPSLADGRWHFGGQPQEVFESIWQGRPEGMPAWGALISADQVWMLVSYVRSLEQGKNVTTENFSGATVERTGH